MLIWASVHCVIACEAVSSDAARADRVRPRLAAGSSLVVPQGEVEGATRVVQNASTAMRTQKRGVFHVVVHVMRLRVQLYMLERD